MGSKPSVPQLKPVPKASGPQRESNQSDIAISRASSVSKMASTSVETTSQPQVSVSAAVKNDSVEPHAFMGSPTVQISSVSDAESHPSTQPSQQKDTKTPVAESLSPINHRSPGDVHAASDLTAHLAVAASPSLRSVASSRRASMPVFAVSGSAAASGASSPALSRASPAPSDHSAALASVSSAHLLPQPPRQPSRPVSLMLPSQHAPSPTPSEDAVFHDAPSEQMPATLAQRVRSQQQLRQSADGAVNASHGRTTSRAVRTARTQLP